MLFFISLATRRIEYITCTPNPDGHWTAQQARNLLMELGDQQPFRFLIHDRDTKFSHAFDDVFCSEGIRVTPVQAPNANAHAERWVRRSALTASTGSSSSAGVTSSTSSVSTGVTTTSTGRTARSTCCHQAGAIQRRRTRSIAYTVGISSADSSMNTRPPEFANPTRATHGISATEQTGAAPALRTATVAPTPTRSR